MMEKLEIISYMVENGYHLMNRTMEEMADLFTVDELWNFAQAFIENDEVWNTSFFLARKRAGKRVSLD